ncbi:MAG: hypothetical protein KDJ14_02230 [Xanthomonadales bacterium]|nr:hypothetical protein [Xanthomonadales bacterium]
MNAGFWREAGVGFALSLCGALVHFVLAPIFGTADSLRAVVLLVAGGYGLLLFPVLQVRVGRIVLAVLWMSLALMLAVFDPGLVFWIGGQLGFFWLVRSLYRHDGLIAAALDAGLCVLALSAALAVASHTHSLFLSLWSLLLVQALCFAVPGRRASAQHSTDDPHAGDRFDQAHRSAEAALRRLSTGAG